MFCKTVMCLGGIVKTMWRKVIVANQKVNTQNTLCQKNLIDIADPAMKLTYMRS